MRLGWRRGSGGTRSRRFRGGLERALLGPVMSGAAFVVERRLKQALRRADDERRALAAAPEEVEQDRSR